jgi:hypothetical protein
MGSMSLTKKYPVNALAKAFGVDRMALTRRLEEANATTQQGVTIRVAFKAWTKREAVQDARLRKTIAEANLAELTLSERRGEIRERVKRVLIDVSIRIRNLLRSIDYNPSKSPQRLSRDIEEAQIFDAYIDILSSPAPKGNKR